MRLDEGDGWGGIFILEEETWREEVRWDRWLGRLLERPGQCREGEQAKGKRFWKALLGGYLVRVPLKRGKEGGY